MNRVFVGDDWAEGHHDIHVMDCDGSSLRACRLVEGLEGVARLHEIIEGLTDGRVKWIV